MPRALQSVMREVLDGWPQDLDPPWRETAGATTLGFDAMDPALTLEAWEPVFPTRRGRTLLGAPKNAHIFHAFDDLAPDRVRCVIVGQDPYPCPAFSTGRAFEAGNVAAWRELEKMFSVSVRTFIQQIVAARTGDGGYAETTSGWLRVRDEVEAGRLALEPAAELAGRWVRQGVLLLNSALTITRFQVAGDAHQTRGHLPLWRPFMVAVLRHLAARGAPLVCIGFGAQAAATLRAAEIAPDTCILREHPARGDAVLALENPFVLGNRVLAARGSPPIAW